MAFGDINIGTAVNDGTGDPIRTAFGTINTNFDKAVEGPASAVADRVAVFDGVTGKLVKDGGVTVAGLVAAGDDADTLGSGTATDGHVLTADGAGGAAWEAAAGGGSAVDDASLIISTQVFG